VEARLLKAIVLFVGVAVASTTGSNAGTTGSPERGERERVERGRAGREGREAQPVYIGLDIRSTCVKLCSIVHIQWANIKENNYAHCNTTG